MSDFCCQAAEKIFELTDPNAPMQKEFTGKCVICKEGEPYIYHVPENLWRLIVPEPFWDEIVCAKCFHGLAIGDK